MRIHSDPLQPEPRQHPQELQKRVHLNANRTLNQFQFIRCLDQIFSSPSSPEIRTMKSLSLLLCFVMLSAVVFSTPVAPAADAVEVARPEQPELNLEEISGAPVDNNRQARSIVVGLGAYPVAYGGNNCKYIGAKGANFRC